MTLELYELQVLVAFFLGFLMVFVKVAETIFYRKYCSRDGRDTYRQNDNIIVAEMVHMYISSK